MESEINKLYSDYFDLIDSFFGSIKCHLGNNEDSHIVLGKEIASYPLISDLFLDAIGDLDQEIAKFWKENGKNVFNSLKNQDSLKCLYSGDLSPVILEKFIKRSSLYIDTVILPDPLFNLALMEKQMTTNKKFFLNTLIRHVFNIWKLKDLILANTKNNIVAIVPVNLSLLDTAEREKLLSVADDKFTGYLNKIIGERFLSKQDCFDYLSKYDDGKEIFNLFRVKDDLPNSFKTVEGLNGFLLDFAHAQESFDIDKKTKGWDLSLYINSQFIRVQEHKYFCNKLSAEPIYDYELPWFFFNYEMGGLDMDASISNALQKENFNWIGNSKIPISVFKRLREEERLDYMRSILRQGITDLKAKNDTNLSNTSKQLEINLKEAFDKQNSEIISLKKEIAKITKEDIPLTIGGCLAGFIPLVGNIISIIFAGRDIKRLSLDKKQKKITVVSKENSFVNLLMKSYVEK